MAFQFDTYSSPYAGSIAELLSAGPRARAAALRARGQGTANTIAGVGQAVAGTIGGILQNRADAPRREMEQLQLGRERRQMTAEQQALAAGKDFAQWIKSRTDSDTDTGTGQGNIDLYAQPKVKNPDGSISTVDSIGINLDGKEYLLPTVTLDGRHFINEARKQGVPDSEIGRAVADMAFEEFQKTGRYLGIFPDVASSNAYGEQLHEDYKAGKYDARPAGRGHPTPQEVIERYGPDLGARFVPILKTMYPEPPPEYGERDPAKDIYDKNTGLVVTPGTPKVEPSKKYPVVVAGPDGRPISKLVTEEEMQAGVPAYRAPNAPSAEKAKFWVVRNGAPVRVSENEYRPGDLPSNTREQGRPVVTGDAGKIADFDTSLDDLAVLNTTLTSTSGATGTSAAIGAGMPAWATDLLGWGAEPKKRQGVIDRVKQVIGKTLEGGVLRKEDEYKYEKILPTIKDTEVVAKAKLAGLEKAIRLRRETTLDALEDANYDVAKFRQRAPHGAAPSGTIRARDAQGKLHEAPAGTALPAGWKVEP
ncbi:MAG: hypothetical protein Q7R41_17855 [Phycisphaerales bacterium]|nr:hypothetical protein [Phycisphaerales bacterium]